MAKQVVAFVLVKNKDMIEELFMLLSGPVAVSFTKRLEIGLIF